ncbi:MAG: hypothetical protein A2Y17_13230 [Clostridiales bacterium GWF2_38_85]|nr:MAG: hypothetical protein A2Y17_13230 [Clostridiales bacterium GWF2_38_85]
MKKFINKLKATAVCAKQALSNKKAEGYVDSGVKILIAVVLGALLLGGLYALFGDTILPTLTTKIQDMFNFAG